MNLQYTLKKGVFKFNTPSPLVLGTAGKSFNNTAYLQDRNLTKDEDVILLSNYLNIDKTRIFMLNQVHGDSIINIDSIDNKPFPVADGIITGTERFCIVIRTADCVPVFVFDRKNNILGAVHSGWKGCRLNITGKLINKMKIEYGTKESNLIAYVLPSIGPESYVIKMDVGTYFKDDIIIKNDNIYLDLWKNVNFSLKREGIPDQNIFLSGLCTFKKNTDFYSYRCGDTGRNLNFAFIENK